MPPLFLFPFLIPAFVGLYGLLVSAPTEKRAFADGFWWGYGFYLTGLYWVCISMLTDVEKYGWMIPFALLGLPAVIALFPAMAGWLVKAVMSPLAGRGSICSFAAIFSLLEYARGHVLTGFPWNLPGYAWAGYDASAQSASVLGIYGLSLVTVLIAAAPAWLLRPGGARTLALIWLVFALMVVAGAVRLHNARPAFVPEVVLRLVQPNIAQHHKWDPALQREGLQKQIGLSVSAAKERITHIIWPETAVPYLLTPDSEIVYLLKKIVPAGGALVLGGLRAEHLQRPDWQVWNSLVALDGQGAFAAVYDKHHLVPFGEYMPLRDFIPLSAEKFIAGPRDFNDGNGSSLVRIPAAPPALALICYEAIFPRIAASAREPRAGWLLNITNDAWFGISSGPYQHFHMSRMRAVEQGLPLVRVANTGISAVTDAYGRITASLPLGVQGVLDAKLPAPAPLTLYSRYGDGIFAVMVACMLGLGLWRRKFPSR